MTQQIDGEHLWRSHDALLAPYAQKHSTSRGRHYTHIPDSYRLPFQRDRERVVYTTAFRRLRGKMQVMPPNSSDYTRNRMSHSFEVAMVARGIARELQLNEDLCEVIALAHDLGHPPFGHGGEKALDDKMRAHGKRFDHNVQSTRIVTVYEKRYHDFDGLNLSIEVLEGLRKHDEVFILGTQTVRWPHMEMQVVDMADEIAYLSADTEDALRGEFVTVEDLRAMPVIAKALAKHDTDNADAKYISGVIVKYFLQVFVAETRTRIASQGIATIADVQNAPEPIAAFESGTLADFKALKQFLFERYYLDERVAQEVAHGQQIIGELFDYLVAHPEVVPAQFNPSVADPVERACDFIAGMTDSYVAELAQRVAAK